MKKLLIPAAVAAIALTGCASPKSTLLPNVKTQGDYVQSVYFDIPETFDSEIAANCIVENVTNDSVILKDSSNSFVGDFTGTYYNINSSKEVGGGTVLQRVSDSRVIAHGTTEYRSMLLKHYLKFGISAKAENGKTRLTFKNLKQTQQDTGFASNDGFTSIGTWGGSGLDEAYMALDNIKNNISVCMDE